MGTDSPNQGQKFRRGLGPLCGIFSHHVGHKANQFGVQTLGWVSRVGGHDLLMMGQFHGGRAGGNRTIAGQDMIHGAAQRIDVAS